MVKVSKALRRILIILITLLIPPIFIFGVSGGVYAAAETEEKESSGIMRELSGLTIDGKKFNADNYPALGFGNPHILYLNEVGYNFYANKQDNYQLTLYIYNPAQLALKEDVRNTVQMKAGAAARYDKYALKIMDASADKLFYKFSIDFTAAEKSAVLSNLDKESRKYIISSLEFYIEGYNATDFAIGRTYTFTGYGAGMDDKGSASPTLETTLSYTVTGEMETIPVELHHTSWRPEGTNGNSEYTQDTIHSVYFAVPNSYAKKYEYLNSVKAEWLEARLAPIFVTGNEETYEAVYKQIRRESVRWGDNNQGTAPEKFILTDLEYALAGGYTYSDLVDKSCELLFCNEWWYNREFNAPGVEVKKRLQSLFLTKYTNGINTKDYVLTSSDLENLIKNEAQNGNFHNDCKVDGDYPSYLFESWDEEKTTKIITLGTGEEITDPNVTVVTSKDLDLKSEEVQRSLWEGIFGKSHVSSSEDYKGIKPIKVMTDSLVNNGSPKVVSDSLYISERDYQDFKNFYEKNKDNSTVYLMRFAVSEYWAARVETREKRGTTLQPNLTGVHDTDSYFAQETCYLNFDILDFEYKKNDESYIIPVSMSPIDIFPELTPPVETKTGSNFWIYGVVIIAALIVVGVVWAKVSPLMNTSKKLRGVKPMVASFIIFAIIAVLRVVAETLIWKFTWLTQVIPYLNYACIGAAALFGVFALATLIRKLLFGKA